MINQVRTLADLQQHEEYFTDQGKAVYLWAMEQNGNAPMTGTKVRFGTPIVRGDTCDISLEVKDGTGTIRLLKTDHWRFHDLYLGQSQGKDMGMWVSYAKDHPYAAAWSMLWK